MLLRKRTSIIASPLLCKRPLDANYEGIRDDIKNHKICSPLNKSNPGEFSILKLTSTGETSLNSQTNNDRSNPRPDITIAQSKSGGTPKVGLRDCYTLTSEYVKSSSPRAN